MFTVRSNFPATDCLLPKVDLRPELPPPTSRYQKPELCHGKGVDIVDRGPFEPRPRHDWMSPEYRGPNYYVPSERNWVKTTEKRDLPPLWKPDIMYMRDEPTWVAFQRFRDKPRYEMGLWEQPSHVPYGTSLPHLQHSYPDALNRRWRREGIFSPSSHKWVNDHEFHGPGLPRDSILFFNEEDWLKYKYIGMSPRVPYDKTRLPRNEWEKSLSPYDD